LSPLEISETKTFFERIKRLNVVIFFEKEMNGSMVTETLTLNVLHHEIQSNFPSTDIDVVFPDKLRNLHRYNYKAVATEQKPRIFRKNGKFFGFDVLFMEIVAKLQNASFTIDNFNMKNKVERANFIKLLFSGEVDLNLNTINSGALQTVRNLLKSVNTYDFNGYCALVPIPPRNSFLRYLFVPYDTASWILMVISLVALGIVWKLFKSQRDSRGLSSVGRIIFRVIAGFLGQAFNFVTTRWFHVMVMQVFIFMVLILGNAYQSLLISLMTVSRNGTRITTVNQMMQGDYNYISDGLSYNLIATYQNNSSILKRMEAKSGMYIDNDINYAAKAANNSVLIMKCDRAHDLIYTDNNEFKHGKPSDFFYILPEKFLTFYESLTTSRYSPFTERLEKISLKIFESGIKQHWKTLLHKLTDEIDLKQISIMKEEFLLKMGDFKYVFKMWGIGLFIASIVFVLELLCHRFQAYRIKRLARIFIRLRNQRRRERLVYVRRNQVQPFVL
jgi:hypothetical protein